MTGKVLREKLFLFIADLFFQAACLLPWIPTAEGKVNTVVFVVRMLRSGEAYGYVKSWLYGFADREVYADNDIKGMASMFYVQIIVLCIMQILGLLHFLLLFWIKNQALYIGLMLLGTFNCLLIENGPELSVFSDSVVTELYPLIMLLVPAVMFIGFRFLESWADVLVEYQALKKRDRELKKERKRRLRFDGKYSPLFYQVIWKNFKYRFETYRIFLIVGGISSGFIFAGIGMQEMLKGQALGSAMFSFLVMSMVMAVFLIVNVLLFYLKNHMKNYNIFLNLGMRRRSLTMYVGIELVSSMFFSVLAGFVLGNVILFLCRQVIGKAQGEGAVFSSVTGFTYLFTFLTVFFIYGVSLMATRDIYIDSGMAGAQDKAAWEEKMPGSKKVLFLFYGEILAVSMACLFTKRVRAESIFILVLFLLGMYFFLKNVWGYLLAFKRKAGKGYYRKLLEENYLYYRFKTVFRYTFFIGIVHICILFIFGREIVSVLTEQDSEKLFPYDYVCLATEEDEGFFGELRKDYGVDVNIYPMVCAANIDNTPSLENAKQVPIQGQQIGISETVYRELCEAVGVEAEKLELLADGSNIYICYQQDGSIKGHPIDYYMDRSVPYIRIGQPLYDFSYNAYRIFIKEKELFPARTVAGESADILVGALHQGEQQNLIVFSDAYMEKVKDDWKTSSMMTGEPVDEADAVEGETIHHWPTRLVLIHAPEQVKEELRGRFEEFEARHELDRMYDASLRSCYDKDVLAEDVKAERIIRVAVNVFISCILFTAGILMLYLKTESEMEERKRKQEFLVCMGMGRKERVRLLRRELGSFFWRPLILATVVTAFFTAAMWHVRCYGPEACVNYLKVWGILYAGYVAVLAIGMEWLKRYVIRRVER